ncbi:MAG: O-antigen ligase family protein [Elainella sp. Prado103]|nr:O-antigen ligase family protein [Elainella sp. Prado103]
MRTLLNIAERVFTIFALLMYSGGPLVVILSGGRSEGQAGIPLDFALVRQLFLLIYLITCCFLLPHWKRALYLLVKEKLLLVLLAWVVLSIFWSADPSLTINRSIALIGTTLFGIYLATRYSLKEQLHLLAWMFGLAILLSILFAVGLPRYGIMGGTHAGTWRGIYTHKNTLGSMMAFSAIVFLLRAVGAKRRLLWLGMVFSFLLLLLSRSTSPLSHLILLVPTFFIFRTLRWRYRSRTFILSLITVVGFSVLSLVILYAESLVRLVGKDLTFTGRSRIWSYAWDMIQERPWLGYGYSSQWSSLGSETGFIWRVVGWEAPNSHNGFLELWLGLGFIGLSIFALQFFCGLFRAVSLISQSRTPEFFLPFLSLLYTVFTNLTESTLLDRNSIYWVLYSMIILASTARVTIPPEKQQVLTSNSTLTSTLTLTPPSSVISSP